MASSVNEILASDFSLQMICKAKNNLKSLNNSRVHLAVLDAQHIPVADGIFDGAFSRGALLN